MPVVPGVPPGISPHYSVWSLCQVVAAALKKSLPPNFHGKFTITVDMGEVHPHNIAVEFRPLKPRHQPPSPSSSSSEKDPM